MTLPWAPAAADVRDEMLGRTLSAVTDDQLQATIDRIAGTLAAELGGLLDDRWTPVATAFVLYATAAQVELRLFPEEQGVSAQASLYQSLADHELRQLKAGLGISQTGAGSAPSFSFPPAFPYDEYFLRREAWYDGPPVTGLLP